jgi:hypothetical protein
LPLTYKHTFKPSHKQRETSLTVVIKVDLDDNLCGGGKKTSLGIRG